MSQKTPKTLETGDSVSKTLNLLRISWGIINQKAIALNDNTLSTVANSIENSIKLLYQHSEKNFVVKNNNSQWSLWDLINKTVEQLKLDNNKLGFERTLLRFLERLPSGDYSYIREEWNEQKF